MSTIFFQYQSKSITPVDEYKCTLSEELLKQAEEELGETAEIRDKLLEEFREWIWKNPRIEKCRMDSKFILKFLRVSKFNLTTAKEMFERYLVFREGLYGHDWFSNIDTERPGIQEFINNGMFAILPNYSKTGEKVLLVRCKACDPNVKNAGDVVFSLMTMVMEIMLDDEENQIKGYRIFLDLCGIRLSHYFMFSFSTWFRIMKHVERTFTARHKGCHLMNLSPTLLFVVKILFKHMKEKMRNVVTFLSTPDEVDFIDRENLPKEYGGKHSMHELIGTSLIFFEHVKQ